MRRYASLAEDSDALSVGTSLSGTSFGGSRPIAIDRDVSLHSFTLTAGMAAWSEPFAAQRFDNQTSFDSTRKELSSLGH